MVRVLFPSTGPQLYVLGKRLHHGLTGCVLAVVGVALAIHDRKDFKRWL